MDMRIPPLRIKIMLESNPLKSSTEIGRKTSFAWDRSRPKGADSFQGFARGRLHLERHFLKLLYVNKGKLATTSDGGGQHRSDT